MNREDLMKHAEVAMSVAKSDLLERGKVLPTLVMVPGKNQPYIMTPVADKNLIPPILMKEKPEAFTWAAELWIRRADSSERREAIEVVGGCGITRVLIRQGFHKQDGKIVFEDRWVPSEIELAGYAVNLGMSDGTLGQIMGVWDVAPSGGRVFYVPTSGFRIWVPEGWRMAREVAADDGKPRPTFYRDSKPHGAVRVTTFWRKTEETRDPRAEARAESERRRQTPGVDNVAVEERQNSVIVSFRQVVKEPKQDQQTRMYVWLVHDALGHILVTFASNVNDRESEIMDEIVSIREIVNRIDRL
jgi:hypothetical protein